MCPRLIPLLSNFLDKFSHEIFSEGSRDGQRSSIVRYGLRLNVLSLNVLSLNVPSQVVAFFV